MFRVGEFEIGPGCRPFVVAELSGNHNGSMSRALSLIDAAYEAGADAVKLQTYKPSTMTLDSRGDGFLIEDESSSWRGSTLYELYEKAHTPWEWHDELFAHIRRKGMIAFSSPFDESSVSFLESLNCPIYKIASFEITDLPLIECVSSTGKPMILSTGMASLPEIQEALDVIRSTGNNPVVLLKCTSTYPASPANTNLRTMQDLMRWTSELVGLSDHSMGSAVAVAAAAMGAVVIEKHLTLSRQDGGVDAAFSMEPEEFKILVSDVKVAHDAIGEVRYGGTLDEQKNKAYRRSIYFSRDLPTGHVLSQEDIVIVRPGLGLEPKYRDAILGKKLIVDVQRGTASRWEVFEG